MGADDLQPHPVFGGAQHCSFSVAIWGDGWPPLGFLDVARFYLAVHLFQRCGRESTRPLYPWNNLPWKSVLTGVVPPELQGKVCGFYSFCLSPPQIWGR